MPRGTVTAVLGNLSRRKTTGHPLWRRLVLAFTLIVFAQANYLTETHLHSPALPAGNAAQGHSESGKAPQRDDPAHCPLCREFLIAGAYISPAAVVLPLPEWMTFAVLQVVHVLPFVATTSHDWRGRAPPLH